MHGLASYYIGLAGIAWFALFIAGLIRPSWFLFFCVSSISLTNFAFFSGEVSTRFAPPDLFFLTLVVITLTRKGILASRPGGIPVFFPRAPSAIFLILLAAILLSLSNPSFDRAVLFGEGQPETVILMMLMFLLLTDYVHTEKDLRHLLAAWVVAAVIAILISIIDMGDTLAPHRGVQYDLTGIFGFEDLLSFSRFPHAFLSPFNFRIQGPFRNPGQLAAFSMTSFFALVAFAVAPKHSRRMKIALWTVAAALFMCALLTARSSIYPSLAIGALLILSYFAIHSKKLFYISLAFIGLSIGFLLFASFVSPDIYNQFFTRNIKELGKVIHGTGFLHGQMESGFSAFLSNPLSGIGFGRYVDSEYQHLIRGYEIHGTVLQFIVETGIVGILSYFVFIGYFLSRAVKNYLLSRKTQWRDFHAILFIGFVSMLPSYLYNRHLRERTFWIYIALIYLSSRLLAPIQHKRSPDAANFEMPVKHLP